MDEYSVVNKSSMQDWIELFNLTMFFILFFLSFSLPHFFSGSVKCIHSNWLFYVGSLLFSSSLKCFCSSPFASPFLCVFYWICSAALVTLCYFWSYRLDRSDTWPPRQESKPRNVMSSCLMTHVLLSPLTCKYHSRCFDFQYITTCSLLQFPGSFPCGVWVTFSGNTPPLPFIIMNIRFIFIWRVQSKIIQKKELQLTKNWYHLD